MNTLFDVAVIGCGPVGATLACLLERRGLDIVVLEREPGIHPLPRAIHFDGECMRVFQAAGVAQALLPRLFVSPGMKFVDAAGRLLVDYTRAQAIGPQGWYPSYRFHQPDLESALRRSLLTSTRVELRRHHEVERIDALHDRACLYGRNRSNGLPFAVSARYVVGCDGARSITRSHTGSVLDDLESHQDWLVLDLILRRARPELGDHSLQHCDPARPATYVRGVGNRRRWELMLMPGDEASRITRPEVVWQLLAKWITPEDAILERAAMYRFHSVLARGWRRGRVLLAGDAAHQMPPFLGQGMCAGIRDAANLAWKLADVVQGHARPALLESYESERAPHVRAFIREAVRLGGVLQSTNVDFVRARDAALAANPERFTTPQPPLGPGVHDGPDRGGYLAPQLLLADGQRMDDAIGYRHALLAVDTWRERVAPLAGQRLAVLCGDAQVQAWLDATGANAVLLRPDRHVAGIARDSASLARLLGRLDPVLAA